MFRGGAPAQRGRMADESCFSTAGLAHSLHVTLPIFTELGREGTTFNLAQLNTGDIGFLVDYYLVSLPRDRQIGTI